VGFSIFNYYFFEVSLGGATPTEYLSEAREERQREHVAGVVEKQVLHRHRDVRYLVAPAQEQKEPVRLAQEGFFVAREQKAAQAHVVAVHGTRAAFVHRGLFRMLN
jgi:alpha-glucuronidase